MYKDMIYDPDQGNRPRVESLIEAIERGNFQEMQRILGMARTGQLINEVNISLQTPLFAVANHPNEQFGLKALNLLLDKNANPYHKDVNKQTILFYVAKLGNSRIMEKLLTQFKYNLEQNDYINQTPLFFASRDNRLKCAELLLQNKADVNHIDYNYQTSIFYAARQGHLQMCKLLAKYGANVVHQDKAKKTAVFFARQRNQRHVIDFLNTFKVQAKRSKIQKNMESSQNSKSKKKRQLLKSDYILVYCNEYGEVRQLLPHEITEFRKTSDQYNKLVDLMQNPDKLDYEPQPQEKKFEKAAQKIINHLWKSQHGLLFQEPVDWQAMRIPDYPTIVKHPMDLGTIKTKLGFNAYHDAEEFKNDINLVFDNCILYNSSEHVFGKIALQMKLEFTNMYNKQMSNL